MKILITGSAGFIGSALKERLEKNGFKIVPYDIRENPKNDIRDYNRLSTEMEDVDGVIHLAAVSRVKVAQEKPLDCVQTNIGGTANVLEACRQLKERLPWVVFGSSREVFGESPVLPVTEDSPRKAINIYGVSKIACESISKMYAIHYGLKVRILRFSNVYTGLRDQLDRVIPKFIIRALKGKDLIINGTGDEQFDFTYIGDTVEGIYATIQEINKNNDNLNDFNISSGVPVTLKELAEIIIEKTNSKSQIKFSEQRAYDVNKFYANPMKAENHLAFKAKISINKGIEFAIEELSKLKEKNGI